jgi:uncharacterized protein
VILPDVNLLLYAYDSTSQFHEKAASWWSACLSSTETVGLAAATAFAFIRIGTSSRAFADPLTVDEAAAHVEAWLQQPMVQVVETDTTDIRTALDLLRRTGGGSNLTSDAQLAALAARYDAVVHTADSDFARFPAISWYNPLA